MRLSGTIIIHSLCNTHVVVKRNLFVLSDCILLWAEQILLSLNCASLLLLWPCLPLRWNRGFTWGLCPFGSQLHLKAETAPLNLIFLSSKNTNVPAPKNLPFDICVSKILARSFGWRCSILYVWRLTIVSFKSSEGRLYCGFRRNDMVFVFPQGESLRPRIRVWYEVSPNRCLDASERLEQSEKEIVKGSTSIAENKKCKFPIH